MPLGVAFGHPFGPLSVRFRSAFGPLPATLSARPTGHVAGTFGRPKATRGCAESDAWKRFRGGGGDVGSLSVLFPAVRARTRVRVPVVGLEWVPGGWGGVAAGLGRARRSARRAGSLKFGLGLSLGPFVVSLSFRGVVFQKCRLSSPVAEPAAPPARRRRRRRRPGPRPAPTQAAAWPDSAASVPPARHPMGALWRICSWMVRPAPPCRSGTRQRHRSVTHRPARPALPSGARTKRAADIVLDVADVAVLRRRPRRS